MQAIELPYAARTFRVLDEVAAERARQNLLLQTGEIPFDCADPAIATERKLPMLMEEFGEVGFAWQMVDQTPPDSMHRKLLVAQLREELLQVAAVAVAIAESLTHDSTIQRSNDSTLQP